MTSYEMGCAHPFSFVETQSNLGSVWVVSPLPFMVHGVPDLSLKPCEGQDRRVWGLAAYCSKDVKTNNVRQRQKIPGHESCSAGQHLGSPSPPQGKGSQRHQGSVLLQTEEVAMLFPERTECGALLKAMFLQ